MTNFETNSIQDDAAETIKLMIQNIELDEIENDLALEIKHLCDDKGKETDAQATAVLLYKLGKVYHKRSPDMFSLIRSAVLYNAALVRKPSSAETIQDDLQCLCTHVLDLANAKIKDVQLIEQEANIIKEEIMMLRKTTAQTLDTIKPIPECANDNELQQLEEEKISSIQELQNQITNNYKQIMADLAHFCEKVMGEPPCRFALIGMGSLARKEITPFSDFENIILLDNKIDRNESYEQKLQYFRWFSVIFQFVLINLQETIVPSVAIASLSGWYYDAITNSGISFDGMMPHACKFPLGRQEFTKNKQFKTELIKPIDEMLKYLSTEADLKNGYCLSDILTRTCFVYKDKDIYIEFEQEVINILESEQDKEQLLNNVKQQVVKDLKLFAARFSLSKIKPNEQFNVKKIVYRSTTLFITALGIILSMRSNSCFDIITELHAKNHISDCTQHKLKYAVALACEIRLRWYMKVNRQCDDIDSIQLLIELVGQKSVENYFQIAYALQCDISKRMNLNQGHFFSTPVLMNLGLMLCFDDQEKLNKLLRFQTKASCRQRLHDFDECLKILEKKPETKAPVCKTTLSKTNNCSQERKTWELFQMIGRHLLDIDCFDDAIDCFQNSTELINNVLSPKTANKKTVYNNKIKVAKSINYRMIGRSLTFQCKNREAVDNVQDSHKILQNIQNDKNIRREFAITLRDHGAALQSIQEHKKAKKYLLKSLQLLEQTSNKVQYDNELSETLLELGRLSNEIGKTYEALNYFKKSLLINQNQAIDVEKNRKVGVVLSEIGRSMMKMDKLDDAKNNFQKSVQINYQLPYSEHDLSIQLTDLGCCLMKMDKLDDAKHCFDRSLKIDEQTSLDVNSDRNVSATLHSLGCCLMKMDKLDDAKHCFDRSLKIQEQTSLDVNSDRTVSATLHDLGCCLMKMDKLDDAKHCFDRSLKIQEQTSLDVNSDRNVSATLHSLGWCLMKMDKLDDAKHCFDRSLKIKEQTSLDVNSDRNVSATLHSLGCCLMKMDKLDDAKHCFDRSLKIQEQTSLDVNSDRTVSVTLHSLGCCLMKMDKLDDAKHCFDRSLKIQEQTSLDVNSDRNVSATLHELGCCLMKMDKLDDAKHCFDRSLKIDEQTSLDVNSDRNVSVTLHSLGCCLMKMDKLDDAKHCFDRSLKIQEQTSLDVNSDRTVSVTLHDLGCCLMKMDKLDDAKHCFDRSLKIQEQTSLDVNSDRNVSATLHSLGCCLMKMDKLDDAKHCFDRSLKIKEQTSLDVNSDRTVSVTLH